MALSRLIEELLEAEGACCLYGYLMQHSDKSSQELADHLGIAPRTIRHYRKKVVDGKLFCEKKKGCYLLPGL